MKLEVVLVGILISGLRVHAQQMTPTVVQGTLTEPGRPPFHLIATVTERADPNERGQIEMYWINPQKWRRTIQSQDFSQTLIVNGNQTFEEDSDDYFPLGFETLAGALVDPTPVLEAWRSGDQLITKANGKAEESGKICFSPTMCGGGGYGLTEIVGAAGHNITFTDYEDFHGIRVARRLDYRIDPGDSLEAEVTELMDWTSPDESRFEIAQATPKEKQIRNIILSDSELHQQALEPLEVIWPQVLDGLTSGETSYYVAIDRSGTVREILPLSVAIERADDSARRQIMGWKFKPLVRDGVPVQTEGVLKLSFNTRAYGPAEPLTDAQARKLASNVIEPEFPPGTAAGATCAVHIAVDSDGKIIEQIPGDCAAGLFTVCSHAVGQWHFSPIMENGKQVPYRAEILFGRP